MRVTNRPPRRPDPMTSACRCSDEPRFPGPVGRDRRGRAAARRRPHMTVYFAPLAWVDGAIARDVRIETADGVFTKVTPGGTATDEVARDGAARDGAAQGGAAQGGAAQGGTAQGGAAPGGAAPGEVEHLPGLVLPGFA